MPRSLRTTTSHKRAPTETTTQHPASPRRDLHRRRRRIITSSELPPMRIVVDALRVTRQPSVRPRASVQDARRSEVAHQLDNVSGDRVVAVVVSDLHECRLVARPARSTPQRTRHQTPVSDRLTVDRHRRHVMHRTRRQVQAATVHALKRDRRHRARDRRARSVTNRVRSSRQHRLNKCRVRRVNTTSGEVSRTGQRYKRHVNRPLP